MSNIERAQRKLRGYYQDSLQRRVVMLEEWRDAFDPADAVRLGEIRRAGHQMRGSAASYGFPDLSDRAEALELAPIDDVHAALVRLIADIHVALEALRADPEPGPPSAD